MKRRAPDQRWWLAPKDERHSSVGSLVQTLRSQEAPRRADMRFWLDMYGCPELSGSSVGTWVTSGIGVPPLSLNISRVIIDAARAEVTQTKPKPTFLTEDGDYKLQRRAKKLQQFAEGLFYDVDQYRLSPRIFDHAGVMGTGVEHVYEAFDKPCVERVPRWELMVPKADSYTNNPRQMIRSKPYDKYYLTELAEQWATAESGNVATRKLAELEAAIDRADPPTQDEIFGVDGRESDLVMVHEAWRLPDGPDAPGRHAICIAGATLLDEEYEENEFPFEFFRWEHDPQFFWGTGICELLQGIQYEINRLTMDIQEAHHLLGAQYWALPRAAGVVENAFNNLPGHTIEFDGPVPPSLVAPVVIGQETFAYLWALYQKAFEIARISPQATMGQTPLGPDASGEAQRVFEDVQNKRFGPVHEDWDQLHMGIAKKLLKVSRKIAKREGSFKARYVGDKFMRSISITDVDIDDKSMVMKVWPTSVLPSTPAGKTATIEQWIKLGWLTPDEGKELLGYPDLGAYMRKAMVNDKLLDDQIDSIVDKGEVKTWPEPYFDISKLKLGMTLAYIDAINMGVEEAKLDLFRQYVKRCAALQGVGQAPPPAPAAPDSLAPVPAPGQPPALPPAPPAGALN